MNKTNPVKQTRAKPGLSGAMEFAGLGGGEFAYIKVLTASEAWRLFPGIQGLPRGIPLFALQAADGTPIALTDSRQAAMAHAFGDELEVKSVH